VADAQAAEAPVLTAVTIGVLARHNEALVIWKLSFHEVAPEPAFNPVDPP
jgi:hypothetical protein